MLMALHVNPKDNVATIFSEGVSAGDSVEIREENGERSVLPVKDDIPYGHKIAVLDIDEKERIIKYGEVIGATTTHIAVGEHVHVHNMVSLRGRGDLGK